MEEATLVILKPDAIAKRLVGDVLTRLSQSGLRIAGMKVVRINRSLAESHYAGLKDQPFFDQIVRYLTGEFHGVGETLAIVYAGENAIQRVRQIAGATHPEMAESGTIRGTYGRIHSETGLFENIIHASSSREDAEREIKLWFGPEELVLEAFPTEEVETTLQKKVWRP